MNAINPEWAASLLAAQRRPRAPQAKLPWQKRLLSLRGPRSNLLSLRGRRSNLIRNLRMYNRSPEQGGYVHDTAMSLFIPPTDVLKTAGTWTDTVGGVANTYMQRRTAADATFILVFPIVPPQNSVAQKGSYLKSLDIWWDVTTAAMDAVSFTGLRRATLPANGAAFGAPVSEAVTADTGHDTAGERLTLDQHKATLTITTPFWLDDDDYLYFELTGDAAATSVFDLYGMRVNYTLRL